MVWELESLSEDEDAGEDEDGEDDESLGLEPVGSSSDNHGFHSLRDISAALSMSSV